MSMNSFTSGCFFFLHSVIALGLIVLVACNACDASGGDLLNNPFAPYREAPQWTKAQVAQGYALWTGDSAVPFYETQPPSQAELKRPLACRTPPGEYEPLILGVWQLGQGQRIDLQVKSSPFPLEVRHVDFLEKNTTNKVTGQQRCIGLPFWLRSESTTTPKAKYNRVFWMTAHPPADAKAGVYKGVLALHITREDGTSTVRKIPFAVEVLPFKLPRADAAFGMYYNPDDHYPEEFKNPETYRMDCLDMVAHGHTSATVYGAQTHYDRQTSTIKTDSHVVQIMEIMQETGLFNSDVPVIYLKEGGHAEANYKELFKRFAYNLRENAEEQGYPELLLYGPDEPEPEKGDVFGGLEDLQIGRTQLRVCTAIYGWFTEEYGEYLDVWIVKHDGLVTETLALANRLGAEVWTYNCASRGTNMAFHRFYSGLHTWVTGVKGNFMWVYSAGVQPQAETFGNYCYVMLSKDGPIPSVGWEARREGIEDYRLMQLLHQLIGEHPATPQAVAAREWVRELRKQLDPVFEAQTTPEYPRDVWQWVHLPMFIERDLWPHFEKNTLDFSDFEYPDMEIQPKDYTRLRNECISHILAMLKS